MINLFEVFDKKAIVLYNSFRFSGINRQTIVIEEDGFLPEDVTTPYQFFADNHTMPKKPLFFNQVKTPRFWSIEGNNESAVIKDMTDMKARIIYKKNYKLRIIERIEWLNKRGHTQFIDYYNQYGFCYAQVLLDANTHRRILKHYFNDKGDIILTENIATNDIMLNWQGQQYLFESKVKFIQFYLEVAGFSDHCFLINSLSVPAAVVNKLSNANHNMLFWQNKITPDIINHIKNLLSKNQSQFKIIVPGHTKYQYLCNEIDQQWHDYIMEAGYVYKFMKDNNHSNQVLILTNSDQLPNIEDMIKQHTHLDFHIAALTEMSNVLMKLNQYSNVNLYPNAKKEQLISLYKQCDIYLDINRGNEILDAVRASFDYQLLILGYHETAHNLEVTAQNNLFDIEKADELYKTLRDISFQKTEFDKRLNLQLQQGSSIDKNDFFKLLKN
ncbi:accessory Sec system glycosylation chaperone GtfB [Staphylococcus xylosus]|uniref:accessory Sec system glycosylation chaperone GtfB n=1 Tax=Staphylococcus xylosus TaxID=1288 RepID=UPI001072BC6C|nr:accessory Sec system glycosylation chaperone GtfB [Staphylococcus xylosus]MBF0811958.1 accessory Sec system glycosylation chaperone GtfB [Staphylococcus xylosus]TFV19953.1 accessory Sec system glycosylation chaperone GtfB [Staphylococcus xylosus]HDD0732936.1 accessory Sec system glycosylation chaperone GtfB [Staphylococcus aureus]